MIRRGTLSIDPPDEYWGDDEPEQDDEPQQDDDREPVPEMDDWDLMDWQDAGADW